MHIISGLQVEIILTYGPASGGGTNTQSLRTFRLLRILRSLKLLARVKALRKLMRMVIKVGGCVATSPK